MDSKEHTPRDYILGALSFILWIKIFKKGEDLLQRFINDLERNKEIEKTLKARSNEILRKFETQLLIEQIKAEIQKLLKEKRWIKFSLATTQMFGLGFCGLLLKYFFSLPKEYLSTSSIILGLGFIITTFISLILALLKK